MTERTDGIQFDEEITIPAQRKSKNQVLPFFKALSEMRKLGLLNDEDENFKRDMEFEKLIEADELDEEYIVENFTDSLNKYMEYFNSVLFNMSDDKLKLLANAVQKQEAAIKKKSKTKKARWRDVKNR